MTGSALDYLEVVGRGRALVHAAAPVIAVPTTAGTGSEVTRNAVLTAEGVKVSLRSAGMLPRVAIVDPLLTLSLPPTITADTGLDALTQCLEPLVCNKAGPITDALAREGLTRAARSLRRAVTHGDDVAARTDMCVASLCGGMALANAALGAVHGFAGPIGGMFPAPHGAVCARLLPEVMAVNVAALRARAPDGEGLARYAEVARILTGDARATIADGIRWVRDLVMELGVRALSRPRRDRGGPARAGRARAAGEQHAGQPDRADRRRAARGADGGAVTSPGQSYSTTRFLRSSTMRLVISRSSLGYVSRM
jgi:alcohol dehydrogenase class IV